MWAMSPKLFRAWANLLRLFVLHATTAATLPTIDVVLPDDAQCTLEDIYECLLDPRVIVERLRDCIRGATDVSSLVYVCSTRCLAYSRHVCGNV